MCYDDDDGRMAGDELLWLIRDIGMPNVYDRLLFTIFFLFILALMSRLSDACVALKPETFFSNQRQHQLINYWHHEKSR